MSALKKNPTFGGRGPAPKTFEKWVLAISRRGAKRFQVHLADSTTKMVAHKNAPDTARRVRAMAPVRVQALDEKDSELGEWEFPDDSAELAQEPAAGYEKAEGDTEEERLLKTFAHLLADAHRLASRQLVEVVGIQARHFAEERKNLMHMQMAAERLARRGRPPRLRVSETDEDEDNDSESEGEDNEWLQTMLGPLVQRYVQKQMVGEPAGANGEAKAEKQAS